MATDLALLRRRCEDDIGNVRRQSVASEKDCRQSRHDNLKQNQSQPLSFCQ
jgi:hypothetical protein